jgi:hypothetical protein
MTGSGSRVTGARVEMSGFSPRPPSSRGGLTGPRRASSARRLRCVDGRPRGARSAGCTGRASGTVGGRCPSRAAEGPFLTSRVGPPRNPGTVGGRCPSCGEEGRFLTSRVGPSAPPGHGGRKVPFTRGGGAFSDQSSRAAAQPGHGGQKVSFTRGGGVLSDQSSRASARNPGTVVRRCPSRGAEGRFLTSRVGLPGPARARWAEGAPHARRRGRR